MSGSIRIRATSKESLDLRLNSIKRGLVLQLGAPWQEAVPIEQLDADILPSSDPTLEEVTSTGVWLLCNPEIIEITSRHPSFVFALEPTRELPKKQEPGPNPPSPPSTRVPQAVPL